jgi:SAM-dependent methyltransferase
MQYLPSSGNLLELGTGYGQDSRFFAGKNFSVTATDFSNTSEQVVKNDIVTFKLVDMSQPLPFAGSSFDVVYSHLAMHYFDTETTESLFKEIKRVLKDGGVLAALFNSTSDTESYEGTEIEPNYREIYGIKKRFFDPEAAKEFAKDFKIIICDNQGTTYKDEAIGVHNLIRLIATKN